MKGQEETTYQNLEGKEHQSPSAEHHKCKAALKE